MSRARRRGPGLISIERIIVRGVSPALQRCEREKRDIPIDVALARAQHQTYAALLRRIARVVELPPSDSEPDCVFVEDTAVVLDDTTVVVTRPGAPSRASEVDMVLGALRAESVRTVVMEPPGTLDGGDVLRAAGTLFIGLSARTNERGASWLGGLARELGLAVVTVRVPSGLHLKTSCSLADEGTLLATRSCPIDDGLARQAGLSLVHVDEPLGANVLALGGGRVLVSSASPKTAELLQARGLHVQTLDISELHKADGALTCPSIRLPAPGAWCT